MLIPALLLCACGPRGVSWAALSVWSVIVSVSSLVVLWGRSPGCSTLLLLPLPSPWLAPRAGSIVMCSCTCLVRVCLPAGGPVCQGVAMCVFAHPHCFAAHRPSLVRGGRPSPSSWVRTSAGLVLSPLGQRWCVFRGSLSVGFLFDELAPSHCRIPSLSGAAYCRPVGFLAGPQVLRWAFV